MFSSSICQQIKFPFSEVSEFLFTEYRSGVEKEVKEKKQLNDLIQIWKLPVYIKFFHPFKGNLTKHWDQIKKKKNKNVRFHIFRVQLCT